MSEVLWGDPRTPARGPRPGLSLDRIAAAGVRIADAEGLAAVSMQRVAAMLDFTKMSLYRYVPGKADLVALMVDRAIGAPPPLTGPGWRERLTEWAALLGAGFSRHPWLLDATVGVRVMGPCEMGWLEAAVSALEGTGLSGAERMDAAVVIVGHVRTIAAQARGAGDPEAQLSAVMAEVLRAHGARFPAVAAAMADAASADGRDDALGFGLSVILDGLGVRIAGRA